MKIALYFKTFKLGELTFENNKYIYNSDLTGEAECKKYPSLQYYKLENSKNRSSDKLYPVFDDFKTQILKRPDILTEIGYTKNDNDYSLLYKYGKIKQNDFKYHIVSEG